MFAIASQQSRVSGKGRKLSRSVKPTGREISFPEDQIIVSKTNLKGEITYANKLFLEVSGFNQAETVGSPHSFIRHPDMPRCVFKLLWAHLQDGREVFAYVNNLCRNGDHYWVLAHVTPSFDGNGGIIGYHSNRRRPNREIIEQQIVPLYAQLRNMESQASDRKVGLIESFEYLHSEVIGAGRSYDEFILSL